MPRRSICFENKTQHVKNHNLASYVDIVDLVKAYDTANHDLLFEILENYGPPRDSLPLLKNATKTSP
jgi:hypothetical protein